MSESEIKIPVAVGRIVRKLVALAIVATAFDAAVCGFIFLFALMAVEPRSPPLGALFWTVAAWTHIVVIAVAAVLGILRWACIEIELLKP